MEPTEFNLEQVALLPSCRLVTYAKDQPQYRPLPVAKIIGSEGRVISRWTFTPEERMQIANGEDLFLEQLTFGGPLQPILPTVGLRDFCPMDVGTASIDAQKDVRVQLKAAFDDLSKSNREMDAFPMKEN